MACCWAGGGVADWARAGGDCFASRARHRPSPTTCQLSHRDDTLSSDCSRERPSLPHRPRAREKHTLQPLFRQPNRIASRPLCGPPHRPPRPRPASSGSSTASDMAALPPRRRVLLVALLAAVALTAAAAAPASAHGSSSGRRGHGVKSRVSPYCRGSSCAAMSALLPQLAFAEGAGPKVFCACADFLASRCFAPRCRPCEPSCFQGADAALAKLPGPFGTGLLCSSGCLPCCQAPDDPNLFEGSTCELPAGGCFGGAK